MNWIDTVNSGIQRYPTLYLKKSWEDSAFAVAHHIFIVLGNGYEWAETKDPAKGGYLTTPKTYLKNGEWERKIDPPYYKNQRIHLHKGVFDPKVKKFEVREIDHELSKRSCCIEPKRLFDKSPINLPKRLYTEDELPKLASSFGRILILNGCEKYGDYNKESHAEYILMAESIGGINTSPDRDRPYPNFNKEYSPFWEIDVSLIKPDWREAGLKHLRFWKEWFGDEKNHKKYNYCPENTEHGTLKGYITKYCKEYSDPPSEEFIKKIRKDYGCPIFNGENWKEMEQYLWKEHLNEVNSFLDETISLLCN